MYLELEQRLRAAVTAHLDQTYQWTPTALVVDSPPKPEMGDFALTVCFELAKHMRRPPRALAQEIAANIQLPEAFSRIEVAGGGYLNVFVDRAAAVQSFAQGSETLAPKLGGKVIVEHTNINPNKAAHIGHLRNAVLGDTWVRLLKARGETVEVQNLQDNTGVQVADVVAAFLYMESADDLARARQRVDAAIAAPHQRFDYLCWDLYAAVSQHYESHPQDLAAWRPATLHAIEAGNNPTAALAEAISTAIAHCHLATMQRLGIRYDVLPRESEILQLHLWETAFEQLKARNAIRLEAEGKNAGCWVMDRATLSAEGEEESKVIVRSNGTVTYVGKDIAYQMWKFGLLPQLEFGFVPFHAYPDGHRAWTTALKSQDNPPAFGRGHWVYNVIDTRQSYLQEIVADGLRALNYNEQAERSVHFSYGMVALSAACAAELGYAPENEGERVDVSGRKGTGVKADDLIDRLLDRTRAEVAERHPEMASTERDAVAQAIAVGALRYFLLKFTRNTVIAFDFKEALSFEGETGPYVQYAAVRAANILNKARAAGETPGTAAADAASFLDDNATWSLLWLAGRLGSTVEQCLATQEPAFMAKYAFQLAQAFNNFYHHTPVLQEADAVRRQFLLTAVELVQRQLTSALALMGIATPAAM